MTFHFSITWTESLPFDLAQVMTRQFFDRIKAKHVSTIGLTIEYTVQHNDPDVLRMWFLNEHAHIPYVTYTAQQLVN